MLQRSTLLLNPARFLFICTVSFVGMFGLAGCDLAKNGLKIDRSSDMEFQDYRDSMAPRLPDVKEGAEDVASIPDLKPYISQPTDTLKPMPLVSISVNQTVPLKDALFELAEQADYDLELDPRIRGSIIFTARNRPFDEVIEKISESAGLRYKFDDDSLKVELDTPYHKIYNINYINYIRKNNSSVATDISVVSGEGADTGSQFKTEATSEADFWGELEGNLKQILEGNNDSSNLRTTRDPKITAVSESAAPVEPVVLTSNGEIQAEAAAAGAMPNAAGQQAPAQPSVQVQAPDAVLRVEPLPIEDEEQESGSSGEKDPFQPRYSMNKQAGIVSVFANEKSHKQIEEYLDALRKSVTTQVLIEAKVLEVSLTDEFSAGVDWRLFSRWFDEGLGRSLTVGGLTQAENLAPLLDPAPNTPFSFLAAYNSSDIDAGVEVLNRFGTVRALASPRLTVLNNQSAVLNVARNVVYFELDITRTEATDTTGPTTDIDSDAKTVPEGVLINVQPSIDLDSQTISMAVRPTVTKISSFVNDPGVAFVVAGLDNTDAVDTLTSRVPVVDVQEFDSIVQLNNGQPIVLGGLINDRATSTQNGIPGLSEAPVLGGLFRNQADKIQKTELVVFLKATIIEGSTGTIHKTDKDMYRTFSQDRRPWEM